MGAFGQDVGGRIIRAFQAGQQERQQQQQLTQQEEERKLRMEALQLQLKKEKLDSKLALRKAQLSEGLALGPQMTSQTPGGVDVPDVSIQGPTGASGIAPVHNLRAGIEREQPLELEAIPEAGLPARSVSISDLLRRDAEQRRQAAMMAPSVLSKQLEITSQNAPVTIPQGAPGAGTTVPKFLAGPTVTASGTAQRQQGQQTFTAEQNRLNRAATAEATDKRLGQQARLFYARLRFDADQKAKDRQVALQKLGEKPPSAAELREYKFYSRGKLGMEEIERPAAQGQPSIEEQVAGLSTAGQFWLNYAPNIAQTQTGQSYIAAQRVFTEARLRADSGAAVPDHEYEMDAKTYFAQPGDTAQTLEQKRRARWKVIEGLERAAGRAVSPEERLFAPAGGGGANQQPQNDPLGLFQ